MTPDGASQIPAADYREFIAAKVCTPPVVGFDVPLSDINPLLKPHQKRIVQWMVAGGRRACFARFGLGKSVMQLEAVRLTRERAGGMGLITLPLGVKQEFEGDARLLRTGESDRVTDAQRAELKAWQEGRPDRLITPKFINRIGQATDPAGIYLTNYEPVRDGKLDPAAFTVASLDEASCLRGFGGTKTFREFMRLFGADGAHLEGQGGVPYRYLATATPAPNDFIEMLAYAAFLDVMDVGQAKTRFFKRNSEKADELTLHPHKEEEFWLWVASWGLFCETPSDLDPAFSDEGYALPELKVIYHEIAVDMAVGAGVEKSGQGRMFRDAQHGLVEASREKRDTIGGRIAKTAEILAASPDDHFILWHDLEAERLAIEAAIPGVRCVWGAQETEAKEATIIGFSEGRIQHLAAKPVMLGSGPNFQYHCHKAVFTGIGFKFNDFIQALHLIFRFLQAHPVEIHIVFAESERSTLKVLLEKWENHKLLVANMTAIIRKYGLAHAALGDMLERAVFDPADRLEVTGPSFRVVHNDCVEELSNPDAWADDSVDLIVTSIPFSTQYEYTPSYNDFGHTDDNDQFWSQMRFLVRQLFRVLKPGRNACIHVKDRIVPGGLTGLGFQTVYPFADDCRAVFREAGFAYIGKKTNLTDVVRENNQTYRLGHTEQLRDGSRMGTGIPEEVLLFRKPQTDRSKGYADTPVEKPRPDYVDRDGAAADYSRAAEQAGKINPKPGTGYSRARWQIDAHHLMRTSGDRLLRPEEWVGFDAKITFRTWKAFNLSQVYDFEHHVRIGEELAFRGKLPPDFMLLPPHSWHSDVWTDTAQMRSLNTLQAAAAAEKHLCPLPFDIVNRLITQFSMPGELVLDPFGGLMTTPYCAIKLGRRGAGVELNPGYFADGVRYVEAAARDVSMPTLFDFLDAEEAADVA